MLQPMVGLKLSRILWVSLLFVVGCSASVTFNASVEDVNADFSTGLPAMSQIPNVPCASQAVCDAAEVEGVTYTCTAGVCDPDPIVVELTIAEVDFEELSSGVLSRLARVQLKRARYDFTQNTNTLDVGPIEIFWGPISATGIDSPGVMRIGTFPGIPASTSPEGEIVLDAVGNDALTDYLNNTSVQVRFFGRGAMDLDPGDDVPQDVMVNADFLFTIKASGDIL